ncbi:MAG: hypothetical protein ACI9TO_000430 [Rickettsiales bacterium]|jgi:hypothetical protein
MKIKTIILALALTSLISSCSSAPKRIGVEAKRPYEVIGKGEAQTTGIMLFSVIPIGQNTKLSRAYDAAVRQAGGDDMVNINITESWFWAYVLNGYKTKIEGDVVRYTDK